MYALPVFHSHKCHRLLAADEEPDVAAGAARNHVHQSAVLVVGVVPLLVPAEPVDARLRVDSDLLAGLIVEVAVEEFGGLFGVLVGIVRNEAGAGERSVGVPLGELLRVGPKLVGGFGRLRRIETGLLEGVGVVVEGIGVLAEGQAVELALVRHPLQRRGKDVAGVAVDLGEDVVERHDHLVVGETRDKVIMQLNDVLAQMAPTLATSSRLRCSRGADTRASAAFGQRALYALSDTNAFQGSEPSTRRSRRRPSTSSGPVRGEAHEMESRRFAGTRGFIPDDPYKNTEQTSEFFNCHLYDDARRSPSTFQRASTGSSARYDARWTVDGDLLAGIVVEVAVVKLGGLLCVLVGIVRN